VEGIKAEQFDPTKPYPEGAWCHGPGTFYVASSRGHIALAKNDWIITFEQSGERLAVTNATYEAYFKEPESQLLVTEAESAAPVEAAAKDKRPRSTRLLEREDS
jgi:hypothetical protein